MATLDWPAGLAWQPEEFTLGVRTPKSRFVAAYTAQVQSLSHLADRYVVQLALPPVYEPQAGEREAFFAQLLSAGDWVRLWHMQRPQPLGTLRGSPTAAATGTGVRSITVNTTPGATLRPGDMLGAPSQLLQCAYPGATANGSGVMVMPLVLPVRRTIPAGTGLVWNKPTGTFQLLTPQLDLSYIQPNRQRALDLQFGEVYT